MDNIILINIMALLLLLWPFSWRRGYYVFFWKTRMNVNLKVSQFRLKLKFKITPAVIEPTQRMSHLWILLCVSLPLSLFAIWLANKNASSVLSLSHSSSFFLFFFPLINIHHVGHVRRRISTTWTYSSEYSRSTITSLDLCWWKGWCW